ncbi:GGDEF domain-containing protein [Halomonas sp. LR5S13]|uniref:GGDEF domain-containing protein n=1 Tax=Halomonas rhizosphaerae TaxID=3043296 RepID=UPI0024A9FD02|nr:GGDEF domain-containing protein [Halomonas rhizosphaerae]MDI5920668.1 GGDEF domain-containing protein [Halomonas rhizosphaerae]
MRAASSRGLGLRLVVAFSLIATLCALVIGYYVSQARQQVGADYTALVTDVVRAQQDPAALRMTLDSLIDSQDRIHLEQIHALLWRIPRRIDGIRLQLRRSELAPASYGELVEELAHVESRLPALEAAVDAAAEQGLDERGSEAILALGMEVEEGLAWAYSELNELLHRASAEQRQLMERLALAVAVLLLLLLLAIAAVMRMLFQLHRQRETMRLQSRTDELTALGNRRWLREAAEQAFERRRRHGASLSLMLLDLDHFKRINDAFGHPVGDAVLVAFSRVLERQVRRVDRVARMGGEEFAILVPDSDLAGAEALAERILRATRAMSLPGPAAEHRLTVSIGVVEAGEERSFDRLYSRADELLYRAKAGGRDRAVTGQGQAAPRPAGNTTRTAIDPN